MTRRTAKGFREAPIDAAGYVDFGARKRSFNKWEEPDEHPIKGQWHVRHTIPAAEGTGYLFGKNFKKLPDALSFCARQTHARLLIHVSGEEWLRIDDQSARYFVFG